MKINVVAIQMDIVPLQAEQNVKKAQALMVDAIKQRGHIDLFVLPEDSFTGPIPYHLNSHILDENSPEIKSFVHFAQRNRCYIVLGSFIKKVGEKLYNTTLVLDDAGLQPNGLMPSLTLIL